MTPDGRRRAGLGGLLMAVFATVSLADPARGHPLEPAHLRLDVGDGEVSATLSVARDAIPPTIVPADTCAAELTRVEPSGDQLRLYSRWPCRPDAVLLSARPDAPPVVVEVLEAGTTTTTLLDARTPRLSLARPDTASRWLWLGAEHLLLGYDHVLLVLGLVALLGPTRRLLWALTTFTLGHTVSLALGATGALSLPSGPVETAIAITLVMVALELAAPPRRPGPFRRAPVLTGLFVGIAHGLGFAGVLTDLGLPAGDQALALTMFNLGLELGQLALVVALLLLGVSARTLSRRLPTPVGSLSAPVFCGWCIGTLGAAWVLERAFGF